MKNQQLPGSLLRLRDGLSTYYEIAGSKSGPVTVFVCGFSVPSYGFDHNFNFLAESGLRVLRYDFYGRGRSSKPLANYTLDFYYGQLNELLKELNIRTKINLIGFSLGAVIAAVYANRHLDKVGRICLTGPAGLGKAPVFYQLLRMPLLGELFAVLFGKKILASGLRQDFYQPEKFQKYMSDSIDQLKDRGFLHSLLSTIKSGILYESEREYQELAKKNKSVLLIWGKKDRQIPYSEHVAFLQIFKGIKFISVENAGHACFYERPETVNPVLLNFLTT